MEASKKKVSTRVRGAAWRRKDAPKARGMSFPGRHKRVEEQGKMSKRTARKLGRTRDAMQLMEARNINERRKREAYYVCFIFLDFLSIIPFCILDM